MGFEVNVNVFKRLNLLKVVNFLILLLERSKYCNRDN